MDKLIEITAAKDVTDEFKEEAKTWAKWDSTNRKKFKYHYQQEERVLVLEGSATIKPLGDDEWDEISIEKGMSVIFHEGFKCKWKIHKRMKKHYALFNNLEEEDYEEEEEEEEEAEEEVINCDVCGKACTEESYFVKDKEQDICPECYKKDEEKYEGAEHQKGGEEVVEEDVVNCDVCGEACTEESYFVKDKEQDICPECYKKDEEKYKGAEHQQRGEEVVEEDVINCDACGKACTEESYFVKDKEQDICPECYKKDEEKYEGAEHQKEGVKWIEEKEEGASSKTKASPHEEEPPKKKATLETNAALEEKQ